MRPSKVCFPTLEYLRETPISPHSENVRSKVTPLDLAGAFEGCVDRLSNFTQFTGSRSVGFCGVVVGGRNP